MKANVNSFKLTDKLKTDLNINSDFDLKNEIKMKEITYQVKCCGTKSNKTFNISI